MLRNRLFSRGKVLTVIVMIFILLLTGCGGSASAPAAESASEDMTEAAQASDTQAAPEEEVPLTTENALVGICFARMKEGDNVRLLNEMRRTLVERGFAEDHLIIQRETGSRTTQMEEIEACLDQGCRLLIVSPVSDERIGMIADRVTEAGAQVLFINCDPDPEEIARWETEGIRAVWIGSTYEDQLACQQSILYAFSGTERGLDFNGDGHIGAILLGGGDEARSMLEETVRDLGSELRVLTMLDYEDAEKTSMDIQEILNEYKKEAELILCSSEAAAQAAADGVQFRHRLVGRDILVIGAGTHEDTCTAIINKLMSGSTFTDFYEQASLAAVAAEDMIEGNQRGHTISGVIFKVTEENAQEVLDQLWKTRPEEEEKEDEKAEG